METGCTVLMSFTLTIKVVVPNEGSETMSGSLLFSLCHVWFLPSLHVHASTGVLGRGPVQATAEGVRHPALEDGAQAFLREGQRVVFVFPL